MDPQLNNLQDQPPQENMPPAMIEQPTQPATPPIMASPKKSHKRAIIMAIVGLLVIMAAVAGYVIYSQMNDSATNSNTTQTTTGASTTLSPLDETTKVLTDGASTESGLTDSDDSGDASDASNAASNVGDSVNENNL